MLGYADKAETPVEGIMKDGEDNDKGHPWEVDTDVECNMGEAPPANTPETKKEGMNVSKHAPVEVNPDQIALATR